VVGSSLKDTGDRIDNDLYKKIGVKGAYNLPIVEETFEVVTDEPTPGMGGMPATGAGGEDKRQLADDKSPRCDGIFELDKAQINKCDDNYEAGNEVPYIRFGLNPGAILRNIPCVDPTGTDVDPLTPLVTSSGTQGKFMIAKETNLAAESGSGGYVLETNTMGTNGTDGTFILDWLRAPLMQLYFLSDPDGAYRDIAQVIR
jgi:hypothetical protein